MNSTGNPVVPLSSGVRRRGYWLALAVLLLGIGATLWSTFYVAQTTKKEKNQSFLFACREIENKIAERLEDHERILRSAGALFEHEQGVTREQWHRFVSRLKLDETLPGIQGIGFALLIPREKLAQHIQKVRAEGFPDYQVRPAGDRELFSSIIYLEPFTNRNLRAFGYDMLRESVRRAAMERARDEDAAALSGKVVLVQETDRDVQAGTLMYAPVYQAGKPHTTVAQRREAILGWVYSPYRMTDLMRGILGQWDQAGGGGIHVQIFDGNTTSAGSLLYDSRFAVGGVKAARGSLSELRVVQSAGRQWTLCFTSSRATSALWDYSEAWLVLLGGASISLLLAGLFYTVLNTRFTAETMAFEATRELRRISTEQRIILDTIPVGVSFIRNRQTQWANLAHDSILGYAPGKSIGLGTAEFYAHKEDYERIGIEGYAQLAKGEVYSAELEMKRKDGALYWCRLLGRAVNPANLEEGSIWILTDITEGRRMEVSLRQSRERLRLATHATSIGVWDWDVAGNVLVWDDSMYRLHGVRQEDFAGAYEAWLRCVHPEDKARVDAEIHAALRGEKEYAPEFRVVRPDGSVRFMQAASKTYRDQAGRAVRMIGTNLDITERKLAEEKVLLDAQTRQRQKSESLARMAGAVAHHFNNKLQVVMMNLDFALMDGAANPELAKTLEEAMHAARRASEVSGLMLTYLGQAQTQRRPLSLSSACLQVLPVLRAIAPKGTLLQDDLPLPGPVILADANQVRQVVTNLVTNAWEAEPDGKGVIRLCVKSVAAADIVTGMRFPVDWHPQDTAYACLEVSDEGCGISTENLEKIFDPFFTTKFTGRGMGLAVVLGIVESHGGSITVDSELGKRSVFRLFFPLTTEALPLTAAPAPRPLKQGEGRTVLLAEDDHSVRHTAATALTRLGFNVLTAEDGAAAVALFRSQPYGKVQLALCDLAMPGMNGWETMAALRQLAPDLPVILCSGHTETEAMAGGASELPQAFLGKPYQLQELCDTIAKVLDQCAP